MTEVYDAAGNAVIAIVRPVRPDVRRSSGHRRPLAQRRGVTARLRRLTIPGTCVGDDLPSTHRNFGASTSATIHEVAPVHGGPHEVRGRGRPYAHSSIDHARGGVSLRFWQSAHSRPSPAPARRHQARRAPVVEVAATASSAFSWNNFQEERWAKWDEPAIKDALAAGGATYISNDAKSSAETQAVERREPDRAGRQRADHPGSGRDGHQTIGGQRGCARAFRCLPTTASSRIRRYCTSPSTTSRLGACKAPRRSGPDSRKGNYVIIKGNKADANADFLRGGYQDVIGNAVNSGTIKIVGGDLYRQPGIPSRRRPRWNSF